MIEYSSRTVAFILSGILFNLHPTLPYLLLAVALLIGAYCAVSVHKLPFDKTTARADREHIIEGARVFLRNPALLRASILRLVGYVLAERLWLSFQPLFAAANMRPFELVWAMLLVHSLVSVERVSLRLCLYVTTTGRLSVLRWAYTRVVECSLQLLTPQRYWLWHKLLPVLALE